MGKIKNENYVVVQGWMVSELGLKGNSLLIYAIIYGFSQTEGQVFNGGLQYLADWTNSTKQGVMNCLKKLMELGLIERNEKIINGVKFVEYYAKKLDGVLNKVAWGGKKSLMGIKQSLPNNINNNINNNIINNKESKKEKTFDEIFDEKNIEGRLKDTFIEFIKSRKLNGKKMTNRALELAIDKVRRMSDSENVQIAIIEQSIENSWQGLFPLKENSSVGSKDLSLYEVEENEDISWARIFEFWEKVLGYKLEKTRDNVSALKKLLELDGEEQVEKLIGALGMRSEYSYLTSSIKNVSDFSSLLKHREEVWSFYSKNRKNWAIWHDKYRENKKRWEI